MSSFLDLQNGFYNALSQGIGFPPGSPFQLIQPSTPLPDGTTDSDLWAYMNNIPPFSLTQNYIQSGGNKFFSDYQTLMSALVPTVKVDFRGDIGPEVFADWVVYVRSLTPFPTSSPFGRDRRLDQPPARRCLWCTSTCRDWQWLAASR